MKTQIMLGVAMFAVLNGQAAVVNGNEANLCLSSDNGTTVESLNTP